MRRTAFAIALLLATAPLASATEIVPEVKPEMRAVEVAAPTIRQDAVVKANVVETRKATTATVQRMNTTTIVILVLAAIGVLAILAAI